MQPRKAALGRPSGTDGSDFSYRMVVDPRYTKVAQGKSRLQTLIISQVVIQLIGALSTFLSPFKDDAFIVSISIGFISLLIGELGRRRSQANFMRVYIVASFIATLLSVLHAIKSNIALEIIQGNTDWTAKKLEIIELGYVVLGIFVEILVIITTLSLIRNMAPAKRAS